MVLGVLPAQLDGHQLRVQRGAAPMVIHQLSSHGNSIFVSIYFYIYLYVSINLSIYLYLYSSTYEPMFLSPNSYRLSVCVSVPTHPFALTFTRGAGNRRLQRPLVTERVRIITCGTLNIHVPGV